MKNKMISVLAILGWMLLLGLSGYQVLDYFKFKNVGKRFTASDGQELCLRVQALDGKPCDYNHQ